MVQAFGKGLFDRNKRSWFPEIEDWTADHNELRYAKLGQMTGKQWFWFHAGAYNLLSYTATISALLIYSTVGLLCLLAWDKQTIGIMLCLLALTQVYGLGKKIKNHKYNKGINLYDIWMREPKLNKPLPGMEGEQDG